MRFIIATFSVFRLCLLTCDVFVRFIQVMGSSNRTYNIPYAIFVLHLINPILSLFHLHLCRQVAEFFGQCDDSDAIIHVGCVSNHIC